MFWVSKGETQCFVPENDTMHKGVRVAVEAGDCCELLRFDSHPEHVASWQEQTQWNGLCISTENITSNSTHPYDGRFITLDDGKLADKLPS